MAYTPQPWADNDPSKPVSAARMLVIEAGLQATASTADSATSAAATAQASANTAQTAANNAQTTATNAASTASTAQTTATNAASTASSAQSTANTALSTASSAVSLSTLGMVTLDSFSGADDDTKLSNALTALAADTYPRTLFLPPTRKYSFATGNLAPFEGLRISGSWGFSNPERNSGSKVATAVGLSMNGGWFQATSTVFQCSFKNLSLEGSGTNATFLTNTSSAVWDCLLLENIYSSALRSLLGTQSQKLLITAAEFLGSWEINNCYSGAFHLGGSDNTFNWVCLLDASPAFATAGGSSGQAHFWADSLDKTVVGPMYITAESLWRGIRVDGTSNPSSSGSTNMGSVQFNGLRAEGRNPGQPCNGSMVTVNGGMCSINGLWMAYGMASPSAGENGFVQHNGGVLDVSGVIYDPTNSSQISTPFVHTVGGTGLDVSVSTIRRGSRGPGANQWGTNRPIVARATAGAENRICDATVSQTTV